MKYHLITYGCQMNTADSEEMALPLQQKGYLATDDIAEADVAIMNTCTVREHAEHKAYSNLGRLREWKAERPERLLIVAGCAATLWGESVKKKYPHIDVVSPATKIEEFGNLIEETLAKRQISRSVDGWISGSAQKHDHLSIDPLIQSSASLFGDSRTAYVTIMRGCNLSCSYCIVPQVRGREKYRPLPEILDEIRGKSAQGFREVMLLGQTVNSYYYREDNGVTDFADLLRAVDALEGVEVIRFMSPHPKHMRARTIEALRDCKKVARHIHLPLQSGSNRILSDMKRLYSREEYASIVASLRKAMPGLQVTTDVIVGYPGETQEEFEETLSLMNDIRFDGLFAFKYSPRPGTDSARLPDDVSETEKEIRNQRILTLNTSIKEASLAAAGVAR